MTSSSSAFVERMKNNPEAKKRKPSDHESEEDRRSRTRLYYGEMTLHFAKKTVAALTEVKEVGTQTDETLSFDNARLELLGGKVIEFDKKVADVKIKQW